MTTDFLLEEVLRVAYAVTLMAVPKLVMAIALLASILGGVWAAWALSGRREFHCACGANVGPNSGLEVRDLVQRATQDLDVARLLPRPEASTISNEVPRNAIVG